MAIKQIKKKVWSQQALYALLIVEVHCDLAEAHARVPPRLVLSVLLATYAAGFAP